MKYLVNTRTKEHRVHTDEYFEDADVWRIVEADEEGWIPWGGGECPLPGWCECEIQTKDGDRLLSREAKRWTWSPNIGDATITHYRPILADKEEAQPKSILGPDFDFTSTGKMPYSAHSPSVFDRLKSAIAASESIPAIIAEIDALLPEGYCVAKRSTVNEAHIEGIGGVTLTSQPAEDMSDWRNWRVGDLVECISTDDDGAGDLFGISIGDVRPITKIGVTTGPGSWGKTGAYRFHSRPAKVTE